MLASRPAVRQSREMLLLYVQITGASTSLAEACWQVLAASVAACGGDGMLLNRRVRVGMVAGQGKKGRRRQRVCHARRGEKVRLAECPPELRHPAVGTEFA